MNTYEAKYIPSEESLCTKSWGRGIFGLIEQINGGRHIFPYYEDLIGSNGGFARGLKVKAKKNVVYEYYPTPEALA